MKKVTKRVRDIFQYNDLPSVSYCSRSSLLKAPSLCWAKVGETIAVALFNHASNYLEIIHSF